MKRCWSRILSIAGKLSAVLAAMGCTPKGSPEPNKPREPREIRWKGQDTQYENTTVVEPANQEHP